MDQKTSIVDKIDDNNMLDMIPEPLNITNVNDYCKIRILEYLPEDDLLNVAEANKQLQGAARYVFKEKYNNGKLHMNSIGSTLDQHDSCCGPQLKFNRSKTLALLRNFGHLISNITINYIGRYYTDPNYLKFLLDVERYFIEYCPKSMDKITIEGITPKETTAFRTKNVQLPNITTVRYSKCTFVKNFSFFDNFPNLQALSLDDHFCHFNIKDWQFPNVKHLHFYSHGWIEQEDCEPHVEKRLYGYDKEVDYNNGIYFIEMLKRNQQLEKLELEYDRVYDYESNFYQFIPNVLKCLNEYFPALHCLHLTFYECYDVNLSEKVLLENVSDFSLTAQNIHVFQHMPFTFKRLERFRINAILGFALFDDELTAVPKFISQNKYLKAIDVSGIAPCEVSQILQLENVLSNVEELSICAHDHAHLSSEAVENFLARSQLIKSFIVCGIDNISDELESKIYKKMPHCPSMRDVKDPELVFGQIPGASSYFAVKKSFKHTDLCIDLTK